MTDLEVLSMRGLSGCVASPPVLNDTGRSDPTGRRRYRRFMQEGLGRTLASPLASTMYGLALGPEAFVDHIRQMVEDGDEDAELPQVSQMRPRPDLETVVRAAVEHFGDDLSARIGTRPHDSLGGAAAPARARRRLAQRWMDGPLVITGDTTKLPSVGNTFRICLEAWRQVFKIGKVDVDLDGKWDVKVGPHHGKQEYWVWPQRLITIGATGAGDWELRFDNVKVEPVADDRRKQ